MQQKHIAMAIAGALAGVSGPASALSVADYIANSATTQHIYVSGASAQDNALERLFSAICSGTSLDIYRFGSNQRVMYCNIDPAKVPGFAAVAGSNRVALFKSSEGGSGNGVQPVSNSVVLQFRALATTNAACQAAVTTIDFDGAGTFYNAHTRHVCAAGDATVANVVPDAGISDVEPALFKQVFGLSDSELANIDFFSQNAVIFGVPVTTALRNALQTQQGLVSGSDDCAQQPSLTMAQLAGAYAEGGAQTWSELLPAGNGVDDNVYVCRRVATSGTQHTYEAQVLGNRCGSNIVMRSAASDPETNEGSGTGNVLACLDAANAAGRWAIGTVSMENVPALQAASANDWRMIKLNGTYPTLKNVAQGKYVGPVGEQTIQWRNGSVGGTVPGGDMLAVLEAVKNQAGDPTILSALNTQFKHCVGGTGDTGDGASGVLALITNGWTPPAVGATNGDYDANPVLHTTRSLNGTNNCTPPVKLFPSD